MREQSGRSSARTDAEVRAHVDFDRLEPVAAENDDLFGIQDREAFRP